MEIDRGKISDSSQRRLCFEDRGNLDFYIDTWMSQFREVGKEDSFLIFGLGRFEYLAALVEQYPDNRIYVFEPDESVYLLQEHKSGLKKLLKQDTLSLFCGKTAKEDFQRQIQIDFRNELYLLQVHVATLPNYKRMYKDEYTYFMEEVVAILKTWTMNRDVILADSVGRGKSYLANLLQLTAHSSVEQLRQSLSEYDLSYVPAVVIAAGPSLDKNIDQLKQFENKIFMIATDTAVKTLYQHGIQPDIMIGVDPLKPLSYMDNLYGKTLPMACLMDFNKEIIHIHKGRKFYFDDIESVANNFLKEYGKTMPRILTGGTVSGAAYSLAYYLGFRKVVFVGLDLAFTDGKDYANATEEIIDINERHTKYDSRNYLYGPGVDGKDVYTAHVFMEFKKWLEEKCRMDSDVEIIDATEGGLLIEGLKLMTLKEALSLYTDNKEKDFKNMISKAEYLFEENVREKVDKNLEEVFMWIQYLPTTLKRAKSECESMRRFLNRGDYESSAFHKSLKKIEKYYDKINNSVGIGILEMFTRESIYLIKSRLNQRFDDKKEELYNLADTMELLLDGYENAVGVFSKVYEELKEE